ncbi:MAG TPA: MBL fold metallo-hydrolase [Lacibacter sp.]|nr:MBL fold metallo-hydrolase [Lacibacter sp.]HMO88309.1 MBL fold metallo-hydrolase [Lacibacter sp.]
MFFQHVYDKSLAQASYFIGCQKAGVAMVIDPKRDVDTYLEIAKQNKMEITHVAETHIHADFLSGARELAAFTGAKLYLSDEGGPGWEYEFDHVGLKDGDTFMVGNLKIEVLHTPGHTPESISFLLTDTPASPEPVMIFTGDFVFVGDIGRPDLLEEAAGFVGTKEAGAHEMYKSINRFNALADYIQVWPGHGAGSACGKALGAVPSSTVGYEKVRNWAFQYATNENGFVKYLLEDQPEPPKYFAMMKKLNKVDRPLLTEVPRLKQLTKEEFAAAQQKGIKVIDTRSKVDFTKGYIPGSINIQNNNSLATWAGWFLNYDESFIIVAPEEQTEDITRKLMRIGLDNILGFVPGVEVWTELGHTLEQREDVGLEEFKSLVQRDNVQVVDVRGAAEYKAGHVEGAINLFVGKIDQHLDKLDTGKDIVIHCQAGDRSSIASSVLARHGIRVKNYTGGYAEWVGTGNPVVTGTEQLATA